VEIVPPLPRSQCSRGNRRHNNAALCRREIVAVLGYVVEKPVVIVLPNVERAPTCITCFIGVSSVSFSLSIDIDSYVIYILP
jgi:hypothetical protein